MKGSIRSLVGFLMVFGAVGGMDNGSPLVPVVLIALAGLALMYSGVQAMNKV